MSILDHYQPESWRFYRYGEDENGDPLFSFWMHFGGNFGVCVYDRNDGAGKWLSTEYDPDEYDDLEPTDELKQVIADALTDRGVAREDVQALPDHEEYFFRLIHGTIDQKDMLPDEVVAFVEDAVGSEVVVE